MAFCGNCGTNVNDGVKFCPSCGTGMSAAPAPSAPPPAQPATPAAQYQQAWDTSAQQADPRDAEQNKTMALLAYILFFIPLLTGDHKKSPFVMFHTNQGTVLFLASFAAQIVSGMLTFIIIGFFLAPLFGIASFVLFLMGIINAVNGKMTPLPVIGKFTIIK